MIIIIIIIIIIIMQNYMTICTCFDACFVFLNFCMICELQKIF